MHLHNHSEYCHEVTKRNLFLGMLGNALLSLVEFVAFLSTSSVTIMTASLHDAGDSCTSFVSYAMESLAKRFQRPKLSLVAVLINSGIVIGSCFTTLGYAVHHLFVCAPIETSGMWILAIFSFSVNLFMALKLGHGHSLNEQSQANHFLEDALGSVAMFAVWLTSGFLDSAITDPIASLGVALYILYRAVPVVFQAVQKIRA